MWKTIVLDILKLVLHILGQDGQKEQDHIWEIKVCPLPPLNCGQVCRYLHTIAAINHYRTIRVILGAGFQNIHPGSISAVC